MDWPGQCAAASSSKALRVDEIKIKLNIWPEAAAAAVAVPSEYSVVCDWPFGWKWNRTDIYVYNNNNNNNMKEGTRLVRQILRFSFLRFLCPYICGLCRSLRG